MLRIALSGHRTLLSGYQMQRSGYQTVLSASRIVLAGLRIVLSGYQILLAGLRIARPTSQTTDFACKVMLAACKISHPALPVRYRGEKTRQKEATGREKVKEPCCQSRQIFAMIEGERLQHGRSLYKNMRSVQVRETVFLIRAAGHAEQPFCRSKPRAIHT